MKTVFYLLQTPQIELQPQAKKVTKIYIYIFICFMENIFLKFKLTNTDVKRLISF